MLQLCNIGARSKEMLTKSYITVHTSYNRLRTG
jgi:hypothetical protein